MAEDQQAPQKVTHIREDNVVVGSMFLVEVMVISTTFPRVEVQTAE